MRNIFKLVLAGFIAAAASVPAVDIAQAADALYVAVPDHNGPCGDPHITGKIKKRFRYQVNHVPNLPDVEIMQFRHIHQHRYKDQSKKWPIGRRYCGATVDLSNGTHREIWYLIEEGMGFATLLDGFGLANEVRGANVEFCVAGFDRWLVYNGRCRILR